IKENIEAAVNKIADRATKPSESIHFMGISSADEVKEGIWKLEEFVAKAENQPSWGCTLRAEFNYSHFCVVLREFTYHAIVVPISSVKKDAGQDWKTNENLFVGIGEISNLPKKQRN